MHNLDRQLKAWPMLYASAAFVYTLKHQINHTWDIQMEFKGFG